jgi:hypothetical protein
MRRKSAAAAAVRARRAGRGRRLPRRVPLPPRLRVSPGEGSRCAHPLYLPPHPSPLPRGRGSRAPAALASPLPSRERDRACPRRRPRVRGPCPPLVPRTTTKRSNHPLGVLQSGSLSGFAFGSTRPTSCSLTPTFSPGGSRRSHLASPLPLRERDRVRGLRPGIAFGEWSFTRTARRRCRRTSSPSRPRRG